MPADRPLEVQSFLDSHPISPFQWGIFGLCFCIVLLDGFDTAAIGYIAPSLITEWGLARPALAPVLSAALFGLAFGSILAGPLADRFGRRAVLLGSVLVFGLACLASSRSGDLTQLIVWRFVTGLGLGAAMPNAVTMTSEFSPAGRRATITNAMWCGFPLGAAFGGFLAAWMIPQYGWRSVLVVGGVVPLILVVALLAMLPESVRFMVLRNAGAERIRAVLRRISGAAIESTSFTLGESASASELRGSIGVVLSGRYLVGSLMLWVSFFMGLVIFYALINWMPVLFRDAGMTPATAALISALFPLGGIGAVFSGWLMDRFNSNLVIAAGFALTSVALYAVGWSTSTVGTMLTVLLAGTLMNTAQSSLPALAAAFYPTSGRATGVAWMIGVGRFGGIAGSYLVAELTRRSLGLSDIFAVVAIPGLFAAAALVIKHYSTFQRAADLTVALRRSAN